MEFKSGRVASGTVSYWGSWPFHFAPASRSSPDRRAIDVDTSSNALNNPSMPRPEAVRRVKSYSAATGYVYQYYFYEVEKVRRGALQGTQYVYMVSVDRHHVFPVRILVLREALENWSARTSQKLTGTEEYAVAKMRLFQAFDEIEHLDAQTPELIVDSSNLEKFLSELDILGESE